MYQPAQKQALIDSLIDRYNIVQLPYQTKLYNELVTCSVFLFLCFGLWATCMWTNKTEQKGVNITHEMSANQMSECCDSTKTYFKQAWFLDGTLWWPNNTMSSMLVKRYIIAWVKLHIAGITEVYTNSALSLLKRPHRKALVSFNKDVSLPNLQRPQL